MPKTAGKNINSDYFNGYYKEIWRTIFPEKTTLAEVDYVIEECGLQQGSSVLDMMSGYGRHALALGRKGMKVVAVDNLPEYSNEINEKAAEEKLDVKSICADILELQVESQFDAVICMGNSLQFFNENDTTKLLSAISSHIKPGGKFIINSWSLAEIVMKQFKEKSWSRFDNLLLLVESKFLLRPARVETTSLIITDNGEREEKQAVDYIFSIAELESMLHKTMFQLKEVYSIPGKKIFSPGDPRAYIVAEKK
ncbi:MAG TPA: class I SAM-dependent methyltransferase [Chitinophagaceae bacterium]|nr:class I SAM-dependent methyltransferase [Chitinophagaceae bacterium]